ncbi:hypothetical protein QZH41_019717, partial [Actinostola sp. cb2023]
RVFPNIIPLYIQGTSSCISLLIVIGNGMKKKKAFCQHEFLNESNEYPTAFCVAQGMLIQYLSNVTALWFIVYSICLVQMIFSKNTIDPRHSTKLQHAIAAACCYLLPWILVGVVFHKGGYGTVVFGRICLPHDVDLMYYTNTMITEIGLGVGCSCLLVVVFKLLRHYHYHHHHHHHHYTTTITTLTTTTIIIIITNTTTIITIIITIIIITTIITTTITTLTTTTIITNTTTIITNTIITIITNTIITTTTIIITTITIITTTPYIITITTTTNTSITTIITTTPL